MWTACRSSEVVIRLLPFVNSGSSTANSVISRLAAARAWNILKAKPCPGLTSWTGKTRRWRNRERGTRAADGRQLEIQPEPSGSSRPRAEVGVDAAGQETRLRQSGGRGDTALHRHSQCANARRWRSARYQVRRAGRV